MLFVLQTLESQLAGEQGSKLDVYEMEVANERGDALQDLAEFNLAVVSGGWCLASLSTRPGILKL
jgi:hypothetical protein